MCQSICLGPVRLDYVPVEAPKVDPCVPKEIRVESKAHYCFNPGTVVYCDLENGTVDRSPRLIIKRTDDKIGVIEMSTGQEKIPSKYVKESDTYLDASGTRRIKMIPNPAYQEPKAPAPVYYRDLAYGTVYTIDTDLLQGRVFVSFGISGSMTFSRNGGVDFMRPSDHSSGIHNNQTPLRILGHLKSSKY